MITSTKGGKKSDSVRYEVLKDDYKNLMGEMSNGDKRRRFGDKKGWRVTCLEGWRVVRH